MVRKHPKKNNTPFGTLTEVPASVLIPVDFVEQQKKEDTGFYITQYTRMPKQRRDYFSIGTEDI